MQGNADPEQDWQNRAARLQQLAEHQAVLICIHPQLFLVRLIFGLQGITNPKPRLLLSSLKEAKASWTADDPWLVITSELLQDSCGLDLIRWTKKTVLKCEGCASAHREPQQLSSRSLGGRS